jgi:hypothetical protein
MNIHKCALASYYLAKIQRTRASFVTIFIHALHSLGIHCFE